MSVLIVWLLLNVTTVIPAAIRAANDNVLKVFAPVMERVPTPVVVKETLLKVKPVAATERLDVFAVKLSCEFPALKVKLVVVSASNDAVLTIDEFKVRVLAVEPLAEIDTTVSV